MRGPEGKIQDKLRDYGRKLGWRVKKRSAVGPFGSNGEPDLEFMRQPQQMFFIEVKAPGKVSTALQEEMQKEIRDCWFPVYEVDNVEDGVTIINYHTEKGIGTYVFQLKRRK